MRGELFEKVPLKFTKYLLAEVSLEKSFECLAVASFVAVSSRGLQERKPCGTLCFGLFVLLIKAMKI